MKLYTEEQVKSAFKIGKKLKYFDEQESDEFANTAIKYFKPIELPSDDDTEQEGLRTCSFKTGNESGEFNGALYNEFMNGAKWMREQILKQTK